MNVMEIYIYIYIAHTEHTQRALVLSRGGGEGRYVSPRGAAGTSTRSRWRLPLQGMRRLLGASPEARGGDGHPELLLTPSPVLSLPGPLCLAGGKLKI